MLPTHLKTLLLLHKDLCHQLHPTPQGVAYLMDKGMLQKEPISVASFLFQGVALSKTSIGEYLGERWV